MVLGAVGTIYLLIKNKLKTEVAILILIVLSIVDHIIVDKQFIKKSSFSTRSETEISPSNADNYILSENTDKARVLNLQNPFNEAITSNFHPTIGGYHGAQVGRYQELIEYSLSAEMSELINNLRGGNQDLSSYHILNMLNVGYIKFGSEPNNVIPNPSRNGAAWFVESIRKASSANEELEVLNSIDTKRTAVVSDEKIQVSFSKTNASIQLVNKSPKAVSYQSSNPNEGFAVFSEIFYPAGWKAYIDGEEAEIKRVNYVLRGLIIPPGNHQIEFRFNPASYKNGNWIMLISGLIIYAILLYLVIKAIRSYAMETGK
jgi:hypothetical protein